MRRNSTEAKSLYDVMLNGMVGKLPDHSASSLSPLHSSSEEVGTERGVSVTDDAQSVENSPNLYRSVVPVEYRQVYGIPFLVMRSHYYGGLKVFLTITSIISYFVNSRVSPTENFYVNQILTHTVEYIVMSWVVAPFIQTHEWIASDIPVDSGSGNEVIKRRKKCCRDGTWAKKPPVDLIAPREVNTRYIPFSLYNDLFMMMNEGFMLNHDINESLDYFPSNAQIFIQSVIFRGILNFFLFLNALLQLQFALQQDQSLLGILLTINSLLICTLNLQAYLWAVVFVVVGTPYWVYMTLTRLVTPSDSAEGSRDDCRDENGKKKIMKGSYMYACLLFMWKRVNY